MLQISLIVFGVVAALVLLFVIFVVLQPSQFRIERKTRIAASPAAIFAQVNDFRKWEDWSPWDKIDPNLQRTYDGAPAGVGAKYAWVGNKQVGEGKMTILESRPGELIQIKLEFLRPFAATNTAEFNFQPEGQNTVVTWAMVGNNNFMGKTFGLLMNMDKMIGKDFEKGLAAMKGLAEAAK